MESMICFMHYEFAYTHTNRKCPNKLTINEIFTFGQTKNFFTKGIPFLELSRASDDEISLHKYSIVIYGVNRRTNEENLRFIIDLKTYNFAQNQKFGVIGDGSYLNTLTTPSMASSNGIFFNRLYHSMDFLSVGTYQHLVVALLYSGDGESQNHARIF